MRYPRVPAFAQDLIKQEREERARLSAAATEALAMLQAIANYPGALTVDEIREHSRATVKAVERTIISGGRE